jgi:hypothetical protein
VPSIFASIFFSGTKYLIYSSSLRKSLTEEETVPYGVTTIISYVGSELNLATVSRLVESEERKVLAENKLYLKPNPLSPDLVTNSATNSVSRQRNFFFGISLAAP